MPSKSKDQFQFMKMVELGKIKAPGLSPKEAKEFNEGVNYKKLPKHVLPKIKETKVKIPKKKRFKDILGV